MERALGISHTLTIGTTSHRRASLLPPSLYSPFSINRLRATPLLRNFRSVSGLSRIRASAGPRQGDDNGENRLTHVSSVNWTKPLVNFAANNFLPLALVSGVLFGLANPTLGCLADSYYLSKFSTFGIFVISGLTLRSDEIGAAVEAWPVGLFGLASILFITPLFSRIILLLKLQPQEFVTGLAIFSCMPTTLSSGVALTRLVGGNSALALAMTVISNLLGILIVHPGVISVLSRHPLTFFLMSLGVNLTISLLELSQPASMTKHSRIPFSISKFIGAGVGVTVPAEKLLRSLVLTLLVPLILGKVGRELSKGLADFADGNRKLLAMINAIFLSFVPWIQVSRSRALLVMVKPTIFLVAVVMGLLVHTVLLAFNAMAVSCLRAISGGSKSPFAERENKHALLLVASQKTLPVMVAVVEQLGGALGESGLLVLPCVAAHLNQIIFDSFLVSLWKQKDGHLENANVA